MGKSVASHANLTQGPRTGFRRNFSLPFVFTFSATELSWEGALKALLSLSNTRRTIFSLKTLLPCLLLCAGAASLGAQNNDGYRRSDRDDQGDRINAGGNWQEFDTEDKMTAARRVRFELISDNTLRENRAVQSRIEIFCENGKFKGSEFTPGVLLGPPTHPGFWGQPKMEVTVRVDNTHGNKGWDWNGRSLSMDKNTTRELVGAQLFRVQFFARQGSEIAEFSPGGLDLGRISRACSLPPKKP